MSTGLIGFYDPLMRSIATDLRSRGRDWGVFSGKSRHKKAHVKWAILLISLKKSWRRDPESNWAERICNPVHNRFAIAPYL